MRPHPGASSRHRSADRAGGRKQLLHPPSHTVPHGRDPHSIQTRRLPSNVPAERAVWFRTDRPGSSARWQRPCLRLQADRNTADGYQWDPVRRSDCSLLHHRESMQILHPACGTFPDHIPCTEAAKSRSPIRCECRIFPSHVRGWDGSRTIRRCRQHNRHPTETAACRAHPVP